MSFVSHKIKPITDDFIEALLKADTGFKDGLHCMFARKLKLEMVTNNKNHIENMRKLYSDIFLVKEKV